MSDTTESPPDFTDTKIAGVMDRGDLETGPGDHDIGGKIRTLLKETIGRDVVWCRRARR